uniref:Uncharacterized protein n=1 Tax=viral metagenome TaxID=1070528 RepID=A0A6C0BCM8_9ZZZZ
MSVNMKQMKNKRAAMEKKQKRNLAIENAALDDPESLFGRALRARGDGWFDIVLQHEKHRGELFETRARIGGHSVARISVNDIIIVAKSGNIYEILGLVSTKSARGLIKDKRIPSSLLVERSEGDEDEGGVVFEDTVEEKPDGDEGAVDVDAI